MRWIVLLADAAAQPNADGVRALGRLVGAAIVFYMLYRFFKGRRK